MGFLNYVKATELYKDDEFMTDLINRFEKMDQYHLLRDAGNIELVKEIIPESSVECRKWFSVCDGGLLFSTTLLGVSSYDEELDLSFSTLQEYNTQEKHRLYQLPEEYVIIAILNYGAPVCISISDTRIYLWDTQENDFTTIWDSFPDFLADEHNIAAQMIEDNALEPVPMKAEEEQDGE